MINKDLLVVFAVALYERVWIEIGSSSAIGLAKKVALYERVWIEIAPNGAPQLAQKCRSLRESVD